jgi:hypothetical protein
MKQAAEIVWLYYIVGDKFEGYLLTKGPSPT